MTPDQDQRVRNEQVGISGATARPWKAWEAGDGFIITDMNNRFVARTSDSTGFIGYPDLPNANLIVRAVNVHEELFQIVKDLRNRSFDPTFKGWDLKQLDIVIAKAGGLDKRP